MAAIDRKKVHKRIHVRVRRKVKGTAERPRLSVHFSGRHIYAQVIDDDKGITLASACTREPDFSKSGTPTHANSEVAALVGRTIAERAMAKNIKDVVFDRGGFKYTGKVKALADAAREKGFNF
jgi:large subunit ribosomal protein L18